MSAGGVFFFVCLNFLAGTVIYNGFFKHHFDRGAGSLWLFFGFPFIILAAIVDYAALYS